MIDEFALDDLFDFDSQVAATRTESVLVSDETSSPDDVYKNSNFFCEELVQYSGLGWLK